MRRPAETKHLNQGCGGMLNSRSQKTDLSRWDTQTPNCRLAGHQEPGKACAHAMHLHKGSVACQACRWGTWQNTTLLHLVTPQPCCVHLHALPPGPFLSSSAASAEKMYVAHHLPGQKLLLPLELHFFQCLAFALWCPCQTAPSPHVLPLHGLRNDVQLPFVEFWLQHPGQQCCGALELQMLAKL